MSFLSGVEIFPNISKKCIYREETLNIFECSRKSYPRVNFKHP
jgi:hypothetical protein